MSFIVLSNTYNGETCAKIPLKLYKKIYAECMNAEDFAVQMRLKMHKILGNNNYYNLCFYIVNFYIKSIKHNFDIKWLFYHYLQHPESKNPIRTQIFNSANFITTKDFSRFIRINEITLYNCNIENKNRFLHFTFCSAYKLIDRNNMRKYSEFLRM